MPEDLTPKIVSETDSADFQPGGGIRETTIVRYMIGRFGPYEHKFDRNPTATDKRLVMDAKKLSLEGLV